MPRQTRLDAQLRADILDRIRGGVKPRVAARMMGVPGATYDRWMDKASTTPTDNGPDPALDTMPGDKLRNLATEFHVELPTNATVKQLANALTSANVHAWDDYRAFRAEIDQADAQANGRLAVQVQTSAMTNPTALLNFMARRWPDEWGQKDQLALTGADGGPINVSVEDSIAGAVRAYLQGVEDAPKPVDVDDE